jgi:hypothetical protein
MKNFSRRDLLKGALAIGGAAAGSRIAGPWVREARAALEPSHFVHIFFPGGLNGLFTGCAQQLMGSFGVTSTNTMAVGNGVFTDKATFGTFPQFALDHWAGIGMWHKANLHTLSTNLNGGGETVILQKSGNTTYLNELASLMGGSSAFKAVYLGDRKVAYRDWDPANGVNLQRVADLKAALSAAGADMGADPNAPDREKSALTLETASGALSQRTATTNPTRIGQYATAYTATVNSLRQPLPPPLTFAEIDTAYGLRGNSAVSSFAAMLAGAEIMIRAAGSNVVEVTEFAPMWDFDANTSGPLSRDKFLGTGSYAGAASRIAPIKTFLTRMLNYPGKNVVVAISGEFVRLLTGHGHGDGTVAALFGKNVKQGLSFPCNASARFSTSTPNQAGFWAAVAQACGVPGQPFGANPHPLIA